MVSIMTYGTYNNNNKGKGKKWNYIVIEQLYLIKIKLVSICSQLW